MFITQISLHSQSVQCAAPGGLQKEALVQRDPRKRSHCRSHFSLPAGAYCSLSPGFLLVFIRRRIRAVAQKNGKRKSKFLPENSEILRFISKFNAVGKSQHFL